MTCEANSLNLVPVDTIAGTYSELDHLVRQLDPQHPSIEALKKIFNSQAFHRLGKWYGAHDEGDVAVAIHVMTKIVDVMDHACEECPTAVAEALERGKAAVKEGNFVEAVKAANALLQWTKARDTLEIWRRLSYEISDYGAVPHFSKETSIEAYVQAASGFSQWCAAHAHALSKIESFNFSSRNLTTLPPEIGYLTGVKELKLSGNYLRTLPREIGNLTALEELILEGNDLRELPEELGNLHVLWLLNLEANRLSELPEGMWQLAQLRHLYLSHNRLSALPAGIGNLTELETVLLEHNQLTTLPVEIGQLSKIEDLRVAHNQLSALPAEIGNLSKLYNCTLEKNQLTALPEEFAQLAAMNTLYLDNNHFASLPSFLAHMPLQRISVRGNPLTPVGVQLLLAELNNPTVAASAVRATLRSQIRAIIGSEAFKIIAGQYNAAPHAIAYWLTLMQAMYPKESHPELYLHFPETTDPASESFRAFYDSLITHAEQDDLRIFLRRLVEMRDFRNAAMRPMVVLKVYRMLEGSVRSEEFRSEMFSHIAQALGECGDRIAWGFNEIELQWHIYFGTEGREDRDVALAEILVGNKRNQVLTECALERARTMHLGDEIEIVVYYQRQLKKILSLPLTMHNMLYASMATGTAAQPIITAQMLGEDACKVISLTASANQVIDILSEHRVWQEKMRKEHPEAFDKSVEELQDWVQEDLEAAATSEQVRLVSRDWIQQQELERVHLVRKHTTEWVHEHLGAFQDRFINP